MRLYSAARSCPAWSSLRRSTICSTRDSASSAARHICKTSSSRMAAPSELKLATGSNDRGLERQSEDEPAKARTIRQDVVLAARPAAAVGLLRDGARGERGDSQGGLSSQLRQASRVAGL